MSSPFQCKTCKQDIHFGPLVLNSSVPVQQHSQPSILGMHWSRSCIRVLKAHHQYAERWCRSLDCICYWLWHSFYHCWWLLQETTSLLCQCKVLMGREAYEAYIPADNSSVHKAGRWLFMWDPHHEHCRALSWPPTSPTGQQNPSRSGSFSNEQSYWCDHPLFGFYVPFLPLKHSDLLTLIVAAIQGWPQWNTCRDCWHFGCHGSQ